ncbi:MAG: selenide, water dikinase SelD [Planctomycetes bacterium]|nr:selenide, water dikinase SelD [Planctomycetota bacterium]
MQHLAPAAHPDLLIGPEHSSDAGVFRLRPDLAIVQSADYFCPLVDDPFVFGQIAAANALSDVYAMGGTPVTALNLVCFPDNEIDLEVLHEMLRGTSERVNAAGAVIVGGHCVRDTEIKLGLSVTGTVHPDRMLTNRTARPGDVLILSKPLGTGFITTANRAGRCPPDVFEAACASMTTLNDTASRAAVAAGASAVTDITGFGLAGHAHELAEASNVTLHLNADAVPGLPGVEPLATEQNRTRANPTNEQFTAPTAQVAPSVSDSVRALLYDPQTSGGLLMAVHPDQVDTVTDRIGSVAAIIGEVARPHDGLTLLVE